MKWTRGAAALALIVAVGCGEDASGCPGVGEHSGGLVGVQITEIIETDCVQGPTEVELLHGLVTLPDTCELVEPSYQDEAMCDYAMRSVCADDEFGWGFNARVFYTGDDTYEGEARFARAFVDGAPICSGRYRIRLTNVR